MHGGDAARTREGLRVSYGRGGVTAMLRVGTGKTLAGEHWLVSPVLFRRLLVLDGSPGSADEGALDVPLPDLSRVLGERPVYAQVVVHDPVDGLVPSQVVELAGSGTRR